MEILKSEQYVSEKLNIKPVSKDRLDSFKESEVDDKTRQFIEDNNLVLTTLEGAPRKVGDGFDCSYNELTNLEGAQQIVVGGGFNCSDNKLTTLEGAPQKVKGDLYCSDNPNLVLPKTKPSWIKGKIITTSWRTTES